MTDVEIGVSPLRSEIERINRQGLVPESRHQRVRGVVNRVRPGVGGLKLNAVREPLRCIHLQAVINGGGRRGYQESARSRCEGVISGGIEWQEAVFGSIPQVGAAQG